MEMAKNLFGRDHDGYVGKLEHTVVSSKQLSINTTKCKLRVYLFTCLLIGFSHRKNFKRFPKMMWVKRLYPEWRN